METDIWRDLWLSWGCLCICTTRKEKQAHIYCPQHVNRYMSRPAVILGLFVYPYDKEGKASTHLLSTACKQIYEQTCGCPGAVCVVVGRRPAAPNTERTPATAECTARWPLSEWGAGWRSVANQHTYISICIHCSCSAHYLFWSRKYRGVCAYLKGREGGGEFNSITIFKSLNRSQFKAKYTKDTVICHSVPFGGFPPRNTWVGVAGGKPTTTELHYLPS